jgi:CRISPR-associated protein Csx17
MTKQKIHVHQLTGCRPTPLAHYLKALGILRLVATDADPNVRGWWKDDVFHLATVLNRDSLESYFLSNYSPTPLLAPWNGGSGFYPKDNKVGIDGIANSTAPRFENYRVAIVQAKTVTAHLVEKPKKGSEKNQLVSACRSIWRNAALHWLDAAMAIGSDGEPVFPAMLGTGGNDGRLDFTSNFMQRLVGLFDVESKTGAAKPNTDLLLKNAFWETPNDKLETAAIGQFLPSSAGAPNGSNGFAGSIRVNPWDFVLMLEGSILFCSGLSRRCQANVLPQAAAPFAVRGSGSGYGSSSSSDVGARGEQWMPLWNQPSMISEVRALFREGKSEINGRPAVRGTDLARAVARMGVARGIDQFQRYGYIERNGLSNLAVPLGRFQVSPRPNQRLLDEATSWIDRLRQIATDRLAAASMLQAYRSCEEAVFNCAQFSRSQDFLDLLIAMARAEDQFLKSPKFSADRAQPIGKLSSSWLSAITEDSPNFRLAVALAAQYGPLDPKANNDRRRWLPIRSHWLPLDASGFRFEKGERGINLGPDQSAVGLNLQRAAIEIMHRRFLAMNRGATNNPNSDVKSVPLQLYHPRLGANWEDVAAFLNYETNDAKILAIARAVMAINFAQAQPGEQTTSEIPTSDGTKSLFGVLRLALPTEAIQMRSGSLHEVQADATVFKRLTAGDVSGAFQLATRKLSNAGLRPKMSLAFGDPSLGTRLATAMAFGLNAQTYTRLAMTIIADSDEVQPRESMAAT